MGMKPESMSFSDLECQNRGAKNKFLDKINELVDWAPIERILRKNYKQIKNAAGGLAYSPLKMFKILLLQRFYDLSDPAMEENLNDRMSFIRFTGFSMAQDIPDYSTICRFRNRLIENHSYEKVFYEFNRQIEKLGLIVKTGVIVDATVVQSSRRPKKTKEDVVVDREEENGSQTEEKIVYSDDAQARFIVKRNEVVYGYKFHVGVDSENGFIKGGHATAANKSDTGQFEEVIIECETRKGEPIYADKGYDSEANRNIAESHGLEDGIMRKKKRGRKESEENKARNNIISSVRYKVEQTFGTIKRLYGMKRLRYLGIEKAQMELLLVAICFNLKKAVRLSER